MSALNFRAATPGGGGGVAVSALPPPEDPKEVREMLATMTGKEIRLLSQDEQWQRAIEGGNTSLTASIRTKRK